MLLNHTNHPSASWPPEQMKTAMAQYSQVQDLPFPTINPQWSHDEVRQEVERQEIAIRQMNPTAVHVMGELTYTHLLVTRLKAIGIGCVASTTKRMATQDDSGNKISSFSFVQFRYY